MHINIASLKIDGFHEPLANLYGVVGFVALETLTNAGRAILNVYADEASYLAGERVLDQIAVTTGLVLVPPDVEAKTEAVAYPDLVQITTEAGGAQQQTPGLDPVSAIGAILYTHLLRHPRLAGSKLVMP